MAPSVTPSSNPDPNLDLVSEPTPRPRPDQVRESSTRPLAPVVIPQELLLTPPPAGVKRPDTQGWLSLVPARTRRFGSTPPRWLWCVVASERLRCYASLDDYYQRDKAAITIHLQHAIVSQVMANLTLTLTLTLALALTLTLTRPPSRSTSNTPS